jgi:hypothetical protein
MRQFFSFWWQCIKLAFWGNTAFANDWQWLVGFPLLAVIVWLADRWWGEGAVSFRTDTATGALAAAGAAFVITWFFAFLIRLFNAPITLFRDRQERANSLQIQLEQKERLSLDGTPVHRDVWLYDAICRIFLGRWEKIPIKDGQLDLSANGFEAIHDLIEQVRQLAFDGRLPIWGKTQGYSALWEKSPPAFWKDNQIHYLSFTDGDPEKLCAVPRDTGGQIISLRELMTNRGTIDALCQTPSVAVSFPTNDANSLRILTGTEEPFDKIDVNEYGVHHTISIGVTDTGSKKISDCKFYRTYIAFTNDHQKTLLDGPFSLDPNERRYVSIAMFNETKDLPHANHLIGLSMPPNAFGAGIMQPQLPPDRRHVVSFVAESQNSKDAVLHCELWVDEGGKLRLEPL